jgi:LysR substrate binding domain
MKDLLAEPFVALPEEAGALRAYWLALDARAGRPARIAAEAATPDETFEAVATGQGVVLMAEGNTTVYARPGIVFRPVTDLAPRRLAVAWRRGDRRAVVRSLVEVAAEIAAATPGCPAEAYARFPEPRPSRYRSGSLPG